MKILLGFALSVSVVSKVFAASCAIATAPAGVCSFSPDTVVAAYGKTIHQFMTFNTADAGTAFPAYFQNPSVAGTRLGAIDTTGTGMPLIHINV